MKTYKTCFIRPPFKRSAWIHKWYILLFSAILVWSCRESAPRKDSRGTRPVVAVTIEPLRWLADQIASDRMTIFTLVPSGSSPETYEPTPRQMAQLSACPLYIKAGKLGFERTWTMRLQANAPQMHVADASHGIRYLTDEEGMEDPHVWTSPRNMLIMADNICKALIQVSPQDSVFFMRNLKAVSETIRKTDQQIRTDLSAKKGRAFLIYHPTLTYFAADYGLKQIALEQEGREPSARQIQQTIDKARQHNIRTFFIQKEFGNRNITAIKQASQTSLTEINPLSYYWPQEMIHTADALK